MINWLKNKLRNWLLEDDKPISLQLEILKHGRIALVTAINSIGLHLMCQSKDGSQFLVTEQDCLNAVHFREVWKHLSNDKMTWEDGTPYNPIT